MDEPSVSVSGLADSNQPNRVFSVEPQQDGVYTFWLSADEADNVTITCYIDGVRYIFEERFKAELQAETAYTFEVDAKGKTSWFHIEMSSDPTGTLESPCWDSNWD